MKFHQEYNIPGVTEEDEAFAKTGFSIESVVKARLVAVRLAGMRDSSPYGSPLNLKSRELQSQILDMVVFNLMRDKKNTTEDLLQLCAEAEKFLAE